MSNATETAMASEELDAVAEFLSPAEIGGLGGEGEQVCLEALADPTAAVERAYAESASARRAIGEIGQRVEAFRVALGVPRKRRVYDFLAGIDADSRGLVEHCWLHGHAPIAALRSVTTAGTDMAILAAIRERVNPVARRTLGRPVLTFENRRLDPETGRVVTFEWWFAGEASASDSVSKGVTVG